MVAVVVGSRLGLEQTSAWVLGSRGQFGSSSLGRAGENVFVNAATGNLIINNRDEFLVGQGPDSALARTYNSMGEFDGDNNDGWRAGVTRRVFGPTGTLNTLGSTITKADWDGSLVVYEWIDAATGYRTTEGAGAYDRLKRDGDNWIWTDGDSQITETYTLIAGTTADYRITSRSDPDGNQLTFEYNAQGYVSKVTTQTVDGHTESTELIYGIDAASADLLELRTTHWDPTTQQTRILTRTRYAYDGSHRLTSVTVDLSPSDSLVSDGKTYVTTYTYDGTSKRVASISQTDGSRINITYETSGLFRVTSISQLVSATASRTTNFAYAAGYTNVTTPDGLVTKLEYDAAGQLTKITEPAPTASGAAQTREFTYNARGDVTRVLTSPTTWTDFLYDDANGDGVSGDVNGLWTRKYVRQGENSFLAAARTYNAQNAVLTETRYRTPDADGVGTVSQPGDPVTTRYVYDTGNHLSFVISSTGSVTQFDYATNGNHIRTRAYTAEIYTDASGLASNVSVSFDAMDDWVAGLPDKTAARITETVYDFRGAVLQTIAYSTNLSSGLPDGGSPKTTTNYVYDQAGNLLSRYVSGMAGVETFVYDGMGRIVSTVGFNGATTSTAFHDALGTTVVTNADGLNQISTYNHAGERIGYVESERGADLVQTGGWPSVNDLGGGATVANWANIAAYTAETRWSVVDGPDGQQTVAMHSGQVTSSINGGGGYTNYATIDPTKAYEFTFYFRKSDLTRHGLYFGLESVGLTVENGTTGADNTNPYFFTASAASQQALLQEDRWYKVVGYVTAQGSALVPAGSLGGVYDTTTGAKVADTTTFRWNDTLATNQVRSRFFNYNDETQLGYSTHFGQPEIRDLSAGPITEATVRGSNLIDLSGWPAVTSTGGVSIPGWTTVSGYSSETRWEVIDGPDGRQVVAALYSGQLNSSTNGGGAYTNTALVDTTKAQEFVFYFRKSDLTTHGLFFGLDSTGVGVQNATTGADNTNPYFFTATSAAQHALLQEDRWYKVVAYVLPTGSAAVAAGALGGVYDMTTGDKVAATTTFRWKEPPPETAVTAKARFFNYNGETEVGYSTYFYKPEIREFSADLINALTPITGTQYRYDSMGRLRVVIDPTGVQTHHVYDRVGRKVAEIDGDGSLTEFKYDAADRLVATVRYATRVTAAKLASLTDAAGNPTGVELAAVRPSVHADDAWSWKVYDDAGRLTRTIDGAGAVVAHSYDGLSQLTSTRAYANTLTITTPATFDPAAATTATALNSLASATLDRTTRHFYDDDGRHIGTLDAEGYLSRVVYDHAGLVVRTHAYAEQVTNASLAATGTFAALRTEVEAPDNPANISTWSVYDGRGFLRGTVNGEGDVTLYEYSPLGHVTMVTRGRRISLPTPPVELTWQPTLGDLTAPATAIDELGAPRVLEVTSYTRDQFGQVLTESRTLTGGGVETITYTYDAMRRLVASHTDVVGPTGDHGTRQRYDRQGRLIGTLGGVGTAALVALGPTPTQAAVDQIYQQYGVTYAYDAAGRLVSVTGPEGLAGPASRTTYFYEPDEQLAYEVNALGEVTGYAYDALNRLTATIRYADRLADPGTLSGGAIPAGFPSRSAPPSTASVTAVAYNVTDTVRTATDALGVVTTFGYNAFQDRTSQTEQRGDFAAAATTRLSTFQYDRRGQLTETVVDAGGLNLKTKARYDAFGRVTKTWDRNNLDREMEYDRAGRLVKTLDVPNLASTYTYDARGNVLSTTDRLQRTTTYAYDAFNREVRTTTPSGITTTARYDDRGSTVSVSVGGRETVWTYDADGRLLTETVDPADLALQTTHAYDSAGHLYETTDGRGRLIRYAYDAANRLLSETVDPTGLALLTTYEYDARGQRVLVTEAGGRVTQVTYNKRGERTDVVVDPGPNGQALKTSYVHDRAGNTLKVIEGAGSAAQRTTKYVYDGGDRLIEKHVDPDGLDLSSVYAYDGNGNVLSRTDKVDATTSLVTRFAYDVENRLTFTIDGTGAISRTVYDAEGQVTRTITYAVRPNLAAGFVYSDANLAGVIAGISTPARDLVEHYFYDRDGRLAFVVDGLGYLTQHKYAATGDLLETVRFSAVVTSAYNHDALATLAEQPAYRAAGLRRERAIYDGAGRQAFGIDAGGMVTAYVRDGAGDVISQTRYATRYTATDQPDAVSLNNWLSTRTSANDQTSRAVYDAVGRQVYTIDPVGAVTAYDYDDAGRVISQTRYATLYTAAGQPDPEAMQTWRGANVSADDQTSRVLYDSAGRQVYAIDAAGAVTAYTRDSLNQVVAQTRYATLYSAGGVVDATILGDWLPANLSADDQTSRVVHDAAGRQIYTIDAVGHVTAWARDGVGNVARQTRYGTRYTATDHPTATALTDWLSTRTSANDQTSRAIYDAVGRQIYAIDASGAVTAWTRDGIGNVTKQIRYATLYAAADQPDAGALATWLSGNVSSLDRTSWARFDAAGQQTFAIDAANYVTGFTYDAGGRTLSQTRYSLQVSVTDQTSTANIATALANDTGKARSRFEYDAAGRLERSFDAHDVETLLQRDAFGRVTDVWSANNYAALRTHTVRTYDRADRLESETRAADTTYWSKTEWEYDGLGRAIKETRAIGLDATGVGLTAGVTTTRTYDHMDRVRTVSQPLSASESAVTTTTYDAFGNVRTVEDPRNNVGRFFYDALNRLTWQVDPEGYATRTTYDLTYDDPATPAVEAYTRETVTRYLTKVSASWTGETPPTVPAGGAAVTTLIRDKLDRVTRVIDAENKSETYGLNAFGDRVSLTNKVGGTTTYEYDQRGLLKTETLPITSVRATGGTAQVVNTYTYDARGNLKQSIEAYGFPEARTTNYTYDKLDRLVEKAGDAVPTTTFNATTGVYSTTSTVPTETIEYDALGNVTLTKAASGALTRFYYDQMGRKTAEVAETGRVTDGVRTGVLRTWKYDAANNPVEMKVYDSAITLPTTSSWSESLIPATGAVRHTVYGYDQNNRLISTTIKNARVGVYTPGTGGTAGSYGIHTTLQDVISHVGYDAAGNVTSTTDARGATTYFFYDKAGRQTAKVDAEKYVTTWTRDAEGNVATERRYANRLTATIVEGVHPTDLPVESSDDRLTTFTYDLNGRRKSETRHGVISHSVSASGQLSVSSTTATIAYDYDGLGNVLKKTEANTDATQYAYDALGRLTQVTHADIGPGLRRVVDTTYNGLGGVTRTTDGQDGVADALRRVTTYTYGAGGRLSSAATRTNLAGEAETLFTRQFAYDLGGNLVRESYHIRSESGGDKVFEGRRYDYDAQGRVVLQAALETTAATLDDAPAAGAVWTVGDQYVVAYNVHGEIASKGVRAWDATAGTYVGGTQETFDYDTAGRLWRSNAGDGVTRLFVHDENGAVTLTISSTGYDLAGKSLTGDVLPLISTTSGGQLLVDTAARTDMVVTFSLYDARGQLTSTIEPRRQLRTATSTSTGPETADIVRSRTFNAFGEVASEIDPRSATYITDFTYNTMGRLILQKSPAVTFTNELGVVSGPVRPEEHRYYDIAGRLVGVRDANGNLTRRTLLAGSGHNGEEAVVTAEFRPAGHTVSGGVFTDYATSSLTRYETNVFGETIKVTDALNRVEERLFDLGGRLIRLYRPERSAGVRLIDYYAYDGLNRRTEHWNNLLKLDDGVTVAKEFTRYDREGRVSAFVDFGGHTTGYSYVWSSGMQTEGLGDFGGWTRTTTHSSHTTANPRQEHVDTDYFGREVGKTDFGGADIEKLFDKGGRLIEQASTRGQQLNFTWYNTGLMASQVDAAGNAYGYSTTNTRADYEYDQAGHRLRERYETTDFTYVYAPSDPWDPYSSYTPGTSTQTTTVRQDATVTYDAQGRMLSFDDAAPAGATSVDWEYDLNGNVRRVQAVYPNLGGGTTPAEQDFWYKYDSQNRMTLVQGARNATTGAIEIVNNQGVALTYDAVGNRATATTIRTGRYVTSDPGETPITTAPYQYEHREEYAYTADGYLHEIRTAAGSWDAQTETVTGPPAQGTLIARDTRDLLGRLTSHDEFGALAYSRASTYDRNSMLTSDVVTSMSSDLSKTTVTTTNYSYNDRVTGLWAGVLTQTTSSSTISSGDAPKPTSNLYDYVWFDDARQSRITHDKDTTSSSSGDIQTSTFSYDVNGKLAYVNIKDGQPRNVTFVTDANGQVMSRVVQDNSSTTVQDPWARYLYFNGLRVGDLTNDGPSGADYASGMNGGRTSGTNTQFQSGGVKYHADFDQAYEGLKPGSVAGAGSAYTVRDGDTLQTVAQAVWGDAQLWYLIADINGLTSADTLVAGQVLTIPAKVANLHNTSETFRPYDPNASIGDVNPTQPKPPKKPGGCGMMGQAIAVIIAIAVTAIVAPYAIAAVANLGAASGFTAAGVSAAMAGGSAGIAAAGISSTALVAGGALAGAAASIASQAFLIATGAQDNIDWKGVGISALSAGFAKTGLAGRFGKFVGGGTGNELAGHVARGAFSNAVVQGVAVTTGLQHKFDWTGVAAASVMSAFDATMGKDLRDASRFGMGTAAAGLGSGAAGAMVRTMIDGTNFGDNLIAVLPDVIGNTIGELVGSHIHNGTDQTSGEPEVSGAYTEPTLLDRLLAQRTFIDDQFDEWRASLFLGLYGEVDAAAVADLAGTGPGRRSVGGLPLDDSQTIWNHGRLAPTSEGWTRTHRYYEAVDPIIVPIRGSRTQGIAAWTDDQGNRIMVPLGVKSDEILAYSARGAITYNPTTGEQAGQDWYLYDENARLPVTDPAYDVVITGSRRGADGLTYQQREFRDVLRYGNPISRFFIENPKAAAGLQIAGGVVEIVAGSVIAVGGSAGSGGIGAPIAIGVGGAIGLRGVDNLWTGLKSWETGTPQQTYLNQGLRRLGMSEEGAFFGEIGVDGILGGGAYAAMRPRATSLRPATHMLEGPAPRPVRSGSTVRGADASPVLSSATDANNILQQAGGIRGPAYPRTPGLGTHASMAELRASGALPGVEGIILTDRTVLFGDVYQLGVQGGRRVEFSLVTERVDGTLVKKLYSGDAWSSPVPRDARLVGHGHPNENAMKIWPSQTDLDVVNARHFRTLEVNPTAQAAPSRIFWGPGPTENTIFYPGYGKW